MVKLRNLLLIGLVFGLIAVEVFSGKIFPAPGAQSQHQLTNEEQGAILSILKNGLGPKTTPQTNPEHAFPKFIDPGNPGEVAGDAIRSNLMTGGGTGPDMSSYTPSAYPGWSQPSDLLSEALPPSGTALYTAYETGGRFWYGESNNILVIFPDESIRSFNKKTGVATTWLQDKLAYPPIADTGAYANYQKNYNAEIVAETSTWVLMKFPSGSVLKVAKPTTAAPPTSQPNVIYGLPERIPGY